MDSIFGNARRPRILLIDDDAVSLQVLRRIFDAKTDLRFATNGADGLRIVREFLPDVILLDAEMPGTSGYEVCAQLKRDPLTADIPVIFVTSHTDAAHEVAALDLGAADFISKPVTETQVRARVKTQLRIKELTDRLRAAALVDGLTGVANRRYFDQRLEQEWRRLSRAGGAISLLYIDVDHFKLYNDSCGHLRGDEALKAVAGAVKALARRSADLVARLGGEEFAVLLPDTGLEEALNLAEQIRLAVAGLAIAHPASAAAPVLTVSIGVTSCSPQHCDGANAERLMPEFQQRADEMLYRAKRAGRNRVDGSEMLPPAGSGLIQPSAA